MSRQSLHPTHTRGLSTATSSAATHASSTTTNRARQYAHLHAALAQLNAHLADTDNLLRMTAVQAEYVRGLGGWTGGLFMAAARVLGEEVAVGGARGQAQAGQGSKDGGGDDEEDTVDGRAGESSVFEQSVQGV